MAQTQLPHTRLLLTLFKSYTILTDQRLHVLTDRKFIVLKVCVFLDKGLNVCTVGKCKCRLLTQKREKVGVKDETRVV